MIGDVPVRSIVTAIISMSAFRKKSRFPSLANRGTDPPSKDICTFDPLAHDLPPCSIPKSIGDSVLVLAAAGMTAA